MDVYEQAVYSKFGPDWVKNNRIHPFSQMKERVKNGATCGPAVLMWHGPPDKELQSVLNATRNVWVVFLSLSVPPKSWLSKIPNGESRGWLLKYGIPDVDVRRPKAWEQQLPWIRRRFEDFLRVVETQTEGPPAWHLLEPPIAPENIIACYLCSIACVEPESSWENGFKEEVSYLVRERKVHPPLDWSQDRVDKEKLRAFLKKLGALWESSRSGLENAQV